MNIHTRILSLALLAGVVAVSSALAGSTAGDFTVTSSLDGKTVLPIRSHWIANPNDTQSIDHVDFFIDGFHAWTQHQAPWYYGGQGNWLITTVLKPGVHKFVVRAYDTANQMAVDTVQARIVAPPAPPAKLAGSWKSTTPRPFGLAGRCISPRTAGRSGRTTSSTPSTSRTAASSWGRRSSIVPSRQTPRAEATRGIPGRPRSRPGTRR